MQTSEAAAPDFDDDEDFRLSAPSVHTSSLLQQYEASAIWNGC